MCKIKYLYDKFDSEILDVKKQYAINVAKDLTDFWDDVEYFEISFYKVDDEIEIEVVGIRDEGDIIGFHHIYNGKITKPADVYWCWL